MCHLKTLPERSAVRSRQLTLIRSIVYVPSVRGHPDLWPAVAIPVGFGVGLAVARGNASLIIAGVVVFTALAAVIFRPEAVLMAWFVAILANGRWLTFHEVGPLYVTEPLLVLLTFGVVVRLLLAVNEHSDITSRSRALRFLLLLAIVMLLPAVGGLLVHTSEFDYQTARNAVLIVYVLFALIAASVTSLRHSYRRWFFVALAGPTIALLLVVTGHAGSGGTTSTGAFRIAAHTFPLAFAIAPIVLTAAARERLIRPVFAIGGSIPFLVGLIFINHRSAWLAFAAATVILFARRVSAPVIVGAVATLACGFLLFTATVPRTSTLGEEIARARTVTSTSDPNAEFRIRFWRAVLAKSMDSPLIGAGFDPYPPSIVPEATVSSYDPFRGVHNSFVAIAYRIGFIPLLLLLALLGDLIRRGFRASVKRDDPRDRAICSALTAVVVYVGVMSAFNVYLEAPYAGPLFWTAVGLLVYAVFAEPFRTRARGAEASDYKASSRSVAAPWHE